MSTVFLQTKPVQQALFEVETQNVTLASRQKKQALKTAPVRSPLRSIRTKCLDCCGGQSREVTLCVTPHCELFPYRFGKMPNFTEYVGRDGEQLRVIPSTLKAIRAKCLECSCGDVGSVKNCYIPECPIYPYRMGKSPNVTEATRKQRRERALRLLEMGKLWGGTK